MIVLVTGVERSTMHVGNRLVGLGLTMLGVTGIVVCLAGILSVWFVASRLQRFNSKLFGQVDQLVAQVERRADQARDAVGETRDLVDELKQTLSDSATDRVAERIASLPEIDNLEQRLASAMERADGLVQRSTEAAELIEQSLVAVADFASERDVDLRRSSELMASIQSVRESLGNAPKSLSEVQSRLAEIRQNRQTQDNRPQIMKLSLGIVTKLDVVQNQMAAVVGRLNETKTRLDQLQNKLKCVDFLESVPVLAAHRLGGCGPVLPAGLRLADPQAITGGMMPAPGQEPCQNILLRTSKPRRCRKSPDRSHLRSRWMTSRSESRAESPGSHSPGSSNRP